MTPPLPVPVADATAALAALLPGDTLPTHFVPVPWLPAVVVAPFVAAVLLGLGQRWFATRPRLAALLALPGPLGALAAVVAAIPLLSGGTPRAPVSIVTRTGHLLELGALKVDLAFVLDPVIAALLVPAALLALALISAARHRTRAPMILAWLSVTVGGTWLVLLADDLLVVLAGLQAVGLGGWGLLGAGAELEEAARSALKPWVFGRVGETALLLAAGLLFWSQGVSSWNARDGLRREQGVVVLTGARATADVGSHKRRPVPIGVEETIARGDSTASGATQAVAGPRLSITGTRDALTVKSTGTLLQLVQMRPFDRPLLFVIGLLLLVAIAARAGLLPLHVWAADAADRGPVATGALVLLGGAAGIGLLIRLDFLFAASPEARAAAVWVGALTALFASTVAVAQHDLPRLVTWAAAGQLGLAAMGVGLGATWIAVLQLAQALVVGGALVLAGGATVDAAGGVRDLRRMGGLRIGHRVLGLGFLGAALLASVVPATGGFAAAASLVALARESSLPGFPRNFVIATVLVAGALLAYAPWRAFLLAFTGPSRAALGTGRASREILPPEPSGVPGWLVVALLVPAAASSLLVWPAAGEGLGGELPATWLRDLLAPVTAWSFAVTHPESAPEQALPSTTLALVAGAGAALVAFFRHRNGRSVVHARAPGPIRRVLQDQYFIDDTYNLLFVRAVVVLQGLATVLEWLLVEGPIRVFRLVFRRSPPPAGGAS